MNFSEGGASNDYVARMAVSQCSVVKPDLLIAEFVFKNRSEGFIDGQNYQIGPWLWMNRLERFKAIRKAPKEMRKTIGKRLESVSHYYEYFNNEIGYLNTLKNMLLVQLAEIALLLRPLLSRYPLQLLARGRHGPAAHLRLRSTREKVGHQVRQVSNVHLAVAVHVGDKCWHWFWAAQKQDTNQVC